MTAQSKLRGRPESRRALLVSIALHVVIGAALIRVLLMPLPLRAWLHFGQAAPVVEEHLRFVETPQAGTRPTPAHPGGNGIPAPRTPPPPLVAPPAVPNALPAAPPAAPAKPSEPAGTGPVVGTGGPAQGARPEYHDARVWVPEAPPVASAPKSLEERVDSAMRASIRVHNDSLALGTPRRQPGDWTFEHNGKKYGIDQQYIHLGPISIPTAVLAALPLNNFQGNPILGANERLLDARGNDIAFQANRALSEDEFRKAVKEERQRKEREHEQRARQRQRPSDQSPSTPVAAKDGT